eukprot:3684945-Rhodomonas_salina.1
MVKGQTTGPASGKRRKHPLNKVAPESTENSFNTDEGIAPFANTKSSEQRTVHIRRHETDPGALPPRFWETRYRPEPGVAGNNVKTTKYTIVTFIPKNLMEQFRRLFN